VAESIDELVREITADMPLTATVSEMEAELGFSPFLVSVYEEGKWFLSLSMTLAEYIFSAASLDNPSLSHGTTLTPEERVSFDSPEGAAAGLKNAISDTLATGNPRELAKTLTEAEGRLVAVYGPAIWGEGFGAVPIQLDTLEFSTLNQTTDAARLSIEDLVLSLSGAGTIRLNRETPDRYVAAIESILGDSEQARASLEATGTERWLIEFGLSMFGYSTEGTIEAVVHPDLVSFDITVAAGGEPTTDLHVTMDAECLEVDDRINSDGPEGFCADDMGMDKTFSMFESIRSALPGLPRPEGVFGVTAVNVHGSWNVSLIGSLIGLGGAFATP
jgi:hypothetical protein